MRSMAARPSTDGARSNQPKTKIMTTIAKMSSSDAQPAGSQGDLLQAIRRSLPSVGDYDDPRERTAALVERSRDGFRQARTCAVRAHRCKRLGFRIELGGKGAHSNLALLAGFAPKFLRG